MLDNINSAESAEYQHLPKCSPANLHNKSWANLEIVCCLEHKQSCKYLMYYSANGLLSCGLFSKWTADVD